MSEWKHLLKAVEWLTFLTMLFSVVAHCLVRMDLLPANELAFAIGTSFVLMPIEGLVAMILISELLRPTRANLVRKQMPGEQLSKAASLVLRHCPVWVLGSSVLVILVAATFGSSGRVQWDFVEPLPKESALIMTSITAILCSIWLPIISSATRMPGNYQQNLVRQMRS